MYFQRNVTNHGCNAVGEQNTAFVGLVALCPVPVSLVDLMKDAEPLADLLHVEYVLAVVPAVERLLAASMIRVANQRELRFGFWIRGAFERLD